MKATTTYKVGVHDVFGNYVYDGAFAVLSMSDTDADFHHIIQKLGESPVGLIGSSRTEIKLLGGQGVTSPQAVKVGRSSSFVDIRATANFLSKYKIGSHSAVSDHQR